MVDSLAPSVPTIEPPDASSTAIIRIVAVALLRGSHLLTVRKRGTDRFMLPGGKFKPNETALACCLREAHEELGLLLDADDLHLVGTFMEVAANEPGHRVLAVVFQSVVPEEVEPEPQAELDALRWLSISTRIRHRPTSRPCS